MGLIRATGIFVAAASLMGNGANADALSEAELMKRLALFGPDFVVERMQPDLIENPQDWISRKPGNYVYRFVAGTDNGDEIQTEQHIPNEQEPGSGWQRQIGDSLVESFETTAERDILIVQEVDYQRGYRIEIEPGVHLPARIEPGAEWEIDAELLAYRTEDGSFAHDGKLTAIHRYEGAFRVRTPAGVFDTVLIREDFLIKLGPMKAEDDRMLFFARDIGLVAEEEGIRASALLLFKVKEETAKVLISYPGMGESSKD